MPPKSATDRLTKAKAKKEEMVHRFEEAQHEADREEAERKRKEREEAKQWEEAM